MNAFVRYTVMGIYKLFYNFKIEGWENVPEKEGVIIASNHRSYADPVILTMPMKRPVTYMAKEELFKNKLFFFYNCGYAARQIGATFRFSLAYKSAKRVKMNCG